MEYLFKILNNFRKRKSCNASVLIKNEGLVKSMLVKRFFYSLAVILFVEFAVPVDSIDASDEWMFQQSYYSHHLPPEVANMYPRPESRSAYRRAYANFLPGESIKGVSRYNRIILRNGNSTDVTIYREDWFQFQP